MCYLVLILLCSYVTASNSVVYPFNAEFCVVAENTRSHSFSIEIDKVITRCHSFGAKFLSLKMVTAGSCYDRTSALPLFLPGYFVHCSTGGGRALSPPLVFAKLDKPETSNLA